MRMQSPLPPPRDGLRHGFISGVTESDSISVNLLVRPLTRGNAKKSVTSVTSVTFVTGGYSGEGSAEGGGGL